MAVPEHLTQKAIKKDFGIQRSYHSELFSAFTWLNEEFCSPSILYFNQALEAG